MKIVREKASKLVTYLFPDDAEITLGATMVTPDYVVGDISDATHEIVTGDGPLAWVPGILSFDEDAWTVADRATYDLVVPVPKKVARSRARLALSRNGLLNTIEGVVNQAGGEVLIWYQDAAEWYRADMNVIGISFALGWSSEKLDDLFRYAELGLD